jgi:molecular chaperone DnaK
METEINLPFITADQSGPKHLVMKLTRARFEQLADPIFKRLMPPVEQALKDAGVDSKKIDEVVLVGGSTRIPKVQELVKSYFGKEPNAALIPTRWWQWARPSRLACCQVKRPTSCCLM